MAKLTTKRRKKLKSTTFGLSAERKYPLDTKARAANAKARAKQQVKKRNLSESQYETIVKKANKKLYGVASTKGRVKRSTLRKIKRK